MTHREKMQLATMEMEVTDEVGNIDLCEVEPLPSTRIIRVIRRVHEEPDLTPDINREYQAQYAHACGYYN